MKNWCGKKKEMNSSSSSPETDEELKLIPVLENTNRRRPIENYTGCACCDRIMPPLTIASLLFVLFFFVIPMIAERWNFTTDKPEILLDSLFYCPTSTSDNIVIFDLKFHISNPNNHSVIYIDPFEVSLFSYYNFLTKMSPLPETRVGPGDFTSVKLLADVSLLDHLLVLDETIRFDLKIHAHFRFIYLPYRANYGVDLLCQDAKVALLTPNSSSTSCASMVGNPLMCSYV